MSDESQINIPDSNQNLISSFFRKFEVRKHNNPLARRHPSNTKTQENESFGIDLVYKKNPIFEQTKLLSTEIKHIRAPRSISAVRPNPRDYPSVSNIFALTFVEKELTTIPKEAIENKHQIRILDLNLNKFTAFPSELLLLKQLKVLHLDHNLIKCLPDEISNLEQLEILSISHNLLQVLPQSISKLTHLFDLNLESNLLNSFGPEITELKALKALNINKNRYTHLPASFCELININDFCFEWFKYTNPPLPPRQRGPEGEQKINNIRDACAELRKKNQKGLNFLSFLQTVSIFPVNLKSVDRTKKSFLHYSAVYEDFSVLNYLVSNVPSILDFVDTDGQTALTASIIKEKYISARYLLKHGANSSKGGGKYGSALHLAVRKLNLQLVKELVMQGDVINKLDKDGHTPLHHSTILMSNGQPEAKAIAHYLLEHGARPSIRNKDNWTPLHLTTRRKDLKTLEWMIWYNKEVEEIHGFGEKFKINQKGGTYKWTPMHIAVYSNAPAVIEILAKANCEIFKRSLNGYAPKRLAHGQGVSLKICEKYEKSYLHQRVLFPQNIDLDRSVDVNLQNLKADKDIYRASKNRFENDILYTEKTYYFDKSLKTKPGYESYLPDYRLASKEHYDSFEVTPETDTHYSLPDEIGNDVGTARHNFCSDLNEDVIIRTNNFTKDLNFTRNSLKLKESTQSPSKDKFSLKFAVFLDLSVSNYESYLENEPNFGVEFCQKELELIKEYFVSEKVFFTERTKLFILLRILHLRILKHISTELNIHLDMVQYSLLPFQDPMLLAVKKGSKFYAKQNELQTASVLIDLVPQTLMSLYALLPRNDYEKDMLKSMMISLLEELYCFRASNFLESVLKDSSQVTLARQNAKRVLSNLRNLYETISLEPKAPNTEESSNAVRRTRAATPSLRPQSANKDNPPQMRRQASAERQMTSERLVCSDVKLNTKITLIPFKLLNKETIQL